MIRKSNLVAACAMVVLAGCSSDTGGNRRDTMTQRQRDSVLSKTGLPGAAGIGKALTASDSLKARQAQIDSASRP